MSSAVTSNQNPSSFNLTNTVVSASVIGETLASNPAIFEEAQFHSIIYGPADLAFASASPATYSLTVEDIARAVAYGLHIRLISAGTVAIDLGTSGTALISLLNLSADNPIADLKFSVGLNGGAGVVSLAVASGAVGISGTGTLFTTLAINKSNTIRVTWASATSVVASVGTIVVL
jgi:hypothetical protein